MIIVRLKGGLGNQMFQYAAGRRLAHVHKTGVKLDLSWFGSVAAINAVRKYGLDAFAVNQDFASEEEVLRLKKTGRNRWFRLFKRTINRILPLFDQSYIQEKRFHFDPDVLTLPDEVYLEGYWQCEKYFKDIEETIRKEFSIKPEQDSFNKSIGEAIAATDSVSIHVRRGDYVTDSATSQIYGMCEPSYYKAAIKLVSARMREPHFFVFSDDPDWVKTKMNFIQPAAFIGHNGPENAYEDMRLMSMCKHHIIANSSFSWWGAWLGQNREKKVIAPARWFNVAGYDTRDLCPESWQRIDSP